MIGLRVLKYTSTSSPIILIYRGIVITTHVPTRFQIVEIFTEGYPQGKFQGFVGKLGIIDNYLLT